MKKNNLLFGLIAFLLLFVAGCAGLKGNRAEEDIPENIHSTFVFFNEERFENNNSIGSLYMKKEDGEIETIANNALDKTVYDNDTQQLLFLDEDATLFRYDGGEEGPEQIDQEVALMEFSSTPDKKVVYHTKEGSVYVRGQENSERVGEGVRHLEFLNDDVYYTDRNYNLIAYNLETREERRIKSGVEEFSLLDDGKAIAYTDELGVLHYLDREEESDTVISSQRVYANTVIKEGHDLYYLESDDDKGISILYRANILENTRPEVVAEAVNTFELLDDTILYHTSDLALYQLQGDGVSKRIAMDVWEYDVLADQIVYLDEDDTLYSWNKEDNTESIVGHDVESYETFSNGRVFYLTKDQELFEGLTKLASNVDDYGAFYDTLVYAEGDALYMIEEGKEAALLTDEIQDYSAVYYQNQQVYQNNLDLADLAGIWEVTSPNYKTDYFEFKENGELTTLFEDSVYNLEEETSYYNYLELSDYNNNITIALEGDALVLDINGERFDMERSTQEEAESYLEEIERQEQAEKEERQRAEAERQAEREQEQALADENIAKTRARSVVSSFITYLPEAINTGGFYYIASYIDESSDFYKEQSDFVQGLYDSGIKEELDYFNVESVSINDDGSALVQTHERFKIYDGDSESTSEYYAEYILNEADEEYYISNLSTDL